VFLTVLNTSDVYQGKQGFVRDLFENHKEKNRFTQQNWKEAGKFIK